MPRHPDSYYQRFTKPYCECRNEAHGHGAVCRSKRYLVVHHIDHARQDQSRENLITICSSCHRKEHRERNFYEGRNKHAKWADLTSKLLQRRRLQEEMDKEAS